MATLNSAGSCLKIIDTLRPAGRPFTALCRRTATPRSFCRPARATKVSRLRYPGKADQQQFNIYRPSGIDLSHLPTARTVVQHFIVATLKETKLRCRYISVVCRARCESRAKGGGHGWKFHEHAQVDLKEHAPNQSATRTGRRLG
jgi:hypothetical protein